MRSIALLVIILFMTSQGVAQNKFADSLRLQVGSQVQVASEGFQPLWSKANRFGMASNKQFDQITWMEVSNSHHLGTMRLLSDSASPLQLSYGATVFNAEHYDRVVLQQGFAQLKYKEWFIRGGRHRDLWDDLDPELSMGSLGTSGNALPIPKITLGIDDYINIPFTKGTLQFKGMIGHGWLGDNRFMESWLHEKSFYGRINLGKWKPYGGVQHYTEWGGQRPSENIYLDRSFKGFLDVLFVQEANDGSLPTEEELAGRRPNRAGDQRGVAELGVYYENEKAKVHVYNQTPFESGKGVDIRNMDRFVGLHIVNKNEHSILRDIVAEFIYTKQMEDFGGSEMQSYYNNGPMKTGWEYEQLVIGNPLFTNREGASNYLPTQPYNWNGTEQIPGNANIINNRLVGGNIATRVKLNETWRLRAKLTGVMNYGARNFEGFYGNGEGLFQTHALLEVNYRRGQWLFRGNVAGDFGELYENVGGSLGVQYSLERISNPEKINR
ncbi:hypothetical protein [Sphingobacterium pedocola]|uniref:Capsule assembly Wzi family protein n=1 Tax=Sphingobacterium pedocola TaxID=2082722 RepID=A0ABR9T392_9SPHI|nr:hypothetical protein [Sphingobacterium pedocola]MBE8719334.1 hypothetical protein [Sphingobacterium pedocola]